MLGSEMTNKRHIPRLPRNHNPDFIGDLQQPLQILRWNRQPIPIRGGPVVFLVEALVRWLESVDMPCPPVHACKAVEKGGLAGGIYSPDGGEVLENVEGSVSLPFGFGLEDCSEDGFEFCPLHLQ